MTVYGALVRWESRAPVERHRWELPDGDFVDVDRLAGARPDSPIVLILHGLEGSSRVGYVRGLLADAKRRGLAAIALNFRGCSGEPNRLLPSYHSGDTRDLAMVVERLVTERPDRPIGIVGFSLGGNVLAKWLGERGDDLPIQVRGGVAVSPPLDLAACAAVLDAPGFWPAIYRGRFLRSLRRKALAKARQFPGLVDVAGIRSSTTFSEFDDRFTAPVNGFPSAAEYWRVSSAGPFLAGVRRPLHILTAADDPFVPPPELLTPIEGSDKVTLELSPTGGHVAFVEGLPWHTERYAERTALDVLTELLRVPLEGAPAARAS
jgi:uncharacterized protein